MVDPAAAHDDTHGDVVDVAAHYAARDDVVAAHVSAHAPAADPAAGAVEAAADPYPDPAPAHNHTLSPDDVDPALDTDTDPVRAWTAGSGSAAGAGT